MRATGRIFVCLWREGRGWGVGGVGEETHMKNVFTDGKITETVAERDYLI